MEKNTAINRPLSKRARQFQTFLNDQGLDFQVQELPASTRTAQDAAHAVGCTLGQIVKSLVFRNAQTGEPLVVLASGPNRVDEKKLANILGGPVEMADAAHVRETTGYSIGGVPPFGHKNQCRLVVDEDLLQYEEVWAAAGTPNAVFKITGELSPVLPTHTVAKVS